MKRKHVTVREISDGTEGRCVVVTIRETAVLKLKNELEKASDNAFADPILGYLIKRCEEDAGLCEDVCQEHKTWEKCFKFIYECARKMAKGKTSCAVRDDVVYEWAEDYYHKDDKAEEEKKAKEEAELKKKAAERLANTEKKPVPAKPIPTKPVVEVVNTAKPAEKKEQPKKSRKDIEGQLDLFALMGM